MIMDHPMFNIEGSESAFNTLPWTPRPTNANDCQWRPHRFVTPVREPPDVDGFTDMTFVLLRREQLVLVQEVSKHLGTLDPEDLKEMIADSADALQRKYLSHMDDRNPMHAVVRGFYTDSLIHWWSAWRALDCSNRYARRAEKLVVSIERALPISSVE
jgi:hypothetical protein